jgi:large subunit ribosomal protein L25
MTNSNIIHAEIREDVGKGASRRLRRQGKIPAVLYGGKKDPATLSVDHAAVLHAAQTESFYSSILEIQVDDGRSQKVVVRDVHHHPYKPQIMHMDFFRVSADELLKMSVPIHYVGAEESEAGKSSGVVIQHLVTEVEIAALPENLPEYLDVDLSNMHDGDVIMLTDIKLPEGVEIPALAHEDADDVMIANTIHIKESQGTGVAAAEEAAAAEAEAMGEIVEGEEPEVEGEVAETAAEAADDTEADKE